LSYEQRDEFHSTGLYAKSTRTVPDLRFSYWCCWRLTVLGCYAVYNTWAACPRKWKHFYPSKHR